MKLDELDDSEIENDSEWRGKNDNDRPNFRKPVNSAATRQKLEEYLEEKKLRNELRDIFDA